MPQAARTKRWQRVVDVLIGALLVLIGAGLLSRWVHEPLHHQGLGISWAVLLIVTGLAVVVGASLRTLKPGRRQSAGFQFELAGWGGSAFLVLWYAVVDYFHSPDAALFAALILIVVQLLASWLRLLSAMRQAVRTESRRPK